jgi:predicted TIM-barrel fold metal-dependent hydrolase
MPSPYRAAALARAHNDWIRERWLAEEPRLRGSIVCPTQDPVAAAAEIRRCAENQRFAQVILVGGSERPYGEPRHLPIFEAAAECGLPVAIHSGAEGVGLAAPSGGAFNLPHRRAHARLRRKHHGPPRLASVSRRL